MKDKELVDVPIPCKEFPHLQCNGERCGLSACHRNAHQFIKKLRKDPDCIAVHSYGNKEGKYRIGR